MKATIGIDPGTPSGVGVITDKDYWAYATDDCSIGECIAKEIEALEIEGYDVMVYLESVHSFPRQGVASAFKFGDSFGQSKGALDALKSSYRLVSPQKWQKTIMGLPKKTDGAAEHKRALKIEAQRRFPKCKPTLKTADGILIAEYGHKERR